MSVYVGFDPANLPRYQPRYSYVGCQTHGDPECLCDVKITEPVMVSAETLMFDRLVTQAVGKPNESNIATWLETYVGCWEAERALVDETVDLYAQAEGRKGGYAKHKQTQDGTAWSRLDPSVQGELRAAWKAQTKWSTARELLPKEITPGDYKTIAKYYNERLFTIKRKQTVSV